MTRSRKTRKFAVAKKLISSKDTRLAKTKAKASAAEELKKKNEAPKEVPLPSRALYFSYNKALGPPYRVLMDTSFLNQAIRLKVDIVEGMMDCLLAKVTPYVTDCVLEELERHGHRFRLALRLAKDPRVQRIRCTHREDRGYGDKCMLDVVTRSRIFIAATCDKELRSRMRKIPGVPVMYVGMRKFKIEQLPDTLV